MASISPQRYAQGRTFDEYLAYLSSSANLERQANAGARTDRSAVFRQAFEAARLTADQTAALAWLTAQPGGPAKMLALSEDWSSDCRRDVPTFARIATDTGMELRIFDRDGQRYSTANVPDAAESPNADLMSQFLNHKQGATWQSIPVCAFFTADLEYLYHFTEYPALYDKDRVVMANIRAPREGESADEARVRGDREFGALLASPFWRIWTSATVDEIISALHRRAVLGVV